MVRIFIEKDEEKDKYGFFLIDRVLDKILLWVFIFFIY